MPREIVLDVGVGYDPKTAPTVLVNIKGAGVQYRARRPKDTVPLSLAEFQLLGWGIQELSNSINDDGEDEGEENAAGAREKVNQLQEKLGEMRAKLRQLAEAILSTEDASDLLERVFDTSEKHAGVDMGTVIALHDVVQKHFADEIAADYEAAGLQPPEPVKKAAKRTTAKKAAAKNSSRKTGARKAAARKTAARP